MTASMAGKTCLVTGFTGGIGFATAAALAGMGATVVGVARDQARGETAAVEIRRRVPGAHVEPQTADLSDLGEVRTLAARVTDRHDRLDVLINNAGVARFTHELTAAGVESTFATNCLGPFLLTGLLDELLRRSAPARVITVSSDTHKQVRSIPWDDLQHGRPYRPLRTYHTTKLLNVLFTYELARRLSGTGVTANCCSPGFVHTGLSREATGGFRTFLRLVRPFQSSPEAGAATSVFLASSAEVAAVSGRYFQKRRPVEPNALAKDPAAAQRLWELNLRLSGLAQD